MALDIFENIFKKQSILGGPNTFYLLFERLGGVDLLEALQRSTNQQIYESASGMIQRYGDG